MGKRKNLVAWMVTFLFTAVTGCERKAPPVTPSERGMDSPSTIRSDKSDRGDELGASSSEAAKQGEKVAEANGSGGSQPGEGVSAPAKAEPPADRGELIRKNAGVIGPIIDDMLAQWQKLDSLSIEFAVQQGPTKESDRTKVDSQTGEGKRDSVILPDGRERIRSVVIFAVVIQQMADEAPDDPGYHLMAARMKKFSDGEFVYTVEENKAGQAASKARAMWPHVDYVGGPGLIQSMIVLHQLERLSDEKVNDSDCYVFRGLSPDGKIRHTYWIEKANGLRRQFELVNESRDNRYLTTVTKVTTPVEFSEDHFQPQIPEGVEVQDLTIPGAVYKPPGSNASPVSPPPQNP